MMNLDLTKILEKARKAADRREDKYHFHPAGEEGASGQGDCPTLRAHYEAGIPMPKKEGTKGDTGAMFVGRVFHETSEELLVSALQIEYPEMCVGREIYVSCEITPGHVAYSPVDIGIATKPGFILVQHQFKDGPMKVYEKHPDAKWVWIGDIKSAAAYGYEKMKGEGLDRSKVFQGLIYLKACGLTEMPFHFIHKDNFASFSIPLKWDQKQWEELILTRKRVATLAKQLKAAKPPLFVESDLAYFNPVLKWKCNYCALSKTHEEAGRGGKAKIVLDEPCSAAVAMEMEVKSAAADAIVHKSDAENYADIQQILTRKCGIVGCKAPPLPNKPFCDKHKITDNDIKDI